MNLSNSNQSPFIIDGGSFIGHDLESGHIYNVKALLSDFNKHGITKGIVGSYRCIYQDLKAGNLEIAEIAKKHPDRIIPLGLVHPAYYGLSPKELVQWLTEELGFRIVGLSNFPSYFPVDFKSPVVREIGIAAAEKNIALQACIKTVTELQDLATTWGDLNIPVMIRWMTGHRYFAISSEILIAEKCKNFLFDIGNATGFETLNLLADRIGSHRLFIASNSPRNIFTCSYANLHDANLTNLQRKNIEGQTLSKALGLPISESKATTVFNSEEWNRLISAPKVDVHWHPDHWNLGESIADPTLIFDRFQYEKVLFFPVLGINYDIEAGNALAAEWTQKDPRIYALIVINPLQPEVSLREIDYYAKHARFVGLKTIQDPLGLKLSSPEYKPILDKAAQLQLPILAHLGGIREAALCYPTLKFIAAHSNWARAQHLKEVPNIYFDFAMSHSMRNETQLSRFIQAVGYQRVLFGSDCHAMTPVWSLAKLFNAKLPDDWNKAILKTNAYSVFPKLVAY